MNFEQEHKWTLLENWKRNVGSDKKPEYKDCSTYYESFRNGKIHKTYDFHYVNPILTEGGVTDVAYYVLKYMLKGSEHEKQIKWQLDNNYKPKEANEVWSKIQSRQAHSLGFGLNAEIKRKYEIDKITGKKIFRGYDIKPDNEIINYLKDGVQRSKRSNEEIKYPLFYHPEQLLTFPLAPYYKQFQEVIDIHDAQDFYMLNDKLHGEIDTLIDYTPNPEKYLKEQHRYEEILKIQELDFTCEF